MSATADVVLIYTEDADFYMLLSHILATAGFKASLVEDLETVMGADLTAMVAVLIDSCDNTHALTAFCNGLKENPSTAHLPLLALIRARHEQSYLDLLKAGIDEGFVRPVSPERILSYLRTISPSASNSAVFQTSPRPVRRIGDLEVEGQTRLIKGKVASAQLSPIEFRLLQRLLETPGRVLSRADLIATVWPESHHVNARTVDVHIAKLRRALEETTGRAIIRTIRSNGYVADVGHDDHQPASTFSKS
jgi:two-component system, OmpR family, phosphate regulon response regulator PhoB